MFDVDNTRHATPEDVAGHIREWLEAMPAVARCRAFAAGSVWYSEAHDIAHDMTTGARALTVAQAAGVLSAFSINTGWPDNVARALAYAQAEPVRHTGLVLAKVDAIATLPALEARRLAPVCDILAGAKVRHFAASIFQPSRCDASAPVALDIHMWRVFGFRHGSAGKRVCVAPDGQRRPLYDVVADGVRLVAGQDYAMPPASLQAAMWILQRGHATEPDYARRYEA